MGKERLTSLTRPATVGGKREKGKLAMKTKRNGPGSYTVSHEGYEVSVTSYEPHTFQGYACVTWIAAAQWDSYLYSDQLYTKREAVETAHYMIRNAMKERE